MVSSRSDGGGDNDGKDDSKSEEKKSSDAPAPDIAGGRSIYVSMELIDHQLSKARKRRRPNTMYKSKEDALRSAVPSSSTSENIGALGGGGAEGRSQDIYNLPPSAMTEAVMRLEKLKALSTRSSSIQKDDF